MRCPKCDQAKSYVVKTLRPIDKAVEMVKERRRICTSCRDPFMTYEVHESEFNRLCDLIKREGPTRSPLRARSTKVEKQGLPTRRPLTRPMKGNHDDNK